MSHPPLPGAFVPLPILLAILGLFVIDPPAAPGALPLATNRLWVASADDVYLQEVGSQVSTPMPVSAVAVLGEGLYAVVGGELRVLQGSALGPVADAPRGIVRLRSLAGALWVAASQGTYRFDGSGWDKVAETALVDLCLHRGQVHGATSGEVFRFEQGKFVGSKPPEGYLSSDTTVLQEDFSQLLADPVDLGPIERLASYSGTLYLLGGGRLTLLEGRTVIPDPVDWGTLPSRVTRDLLSQGSRLLVATDRGLGVLRGMAMTSVRGPDGLPYEDCTCLAPGFDGDVWIGTTRGAIRSTRDEFHYFGATHWLPGDGVRDIAVAGRTVYIATDAGLGIIRYVPFTLQKKEAWYMREMAQWGFKRLGFVHKLYRSSREGEWLREISDNDGGNTAPYLGAMSLKYAVTGDEAARQEAFEAFKALVWLDDITPQTGFIARAVWSVPGDVGERSKYGSGGLPAKWYPTPDGQWLWKGDTSSDEVSAHFFGMALFHDLAAKGAEKARAARHIANIAGHILDNGWVLRDLDGKPTRWGRWDPAYLQRPYGFEARGLNGMEAQTYMQTAFALTGEARFADGLKQLLDWRYHTHTVRQRITFPPEQFAPWDDELAFFCYYPLLRYATDEDLRSIYLRSLDRTWEILRIQKIPFYNFIYGAMTGNDCEVPEAIRHLREWPLDLVNHRFHNSHRHDLAAGPGYVPYGGGTRAISPRESEARWGARNSLEYDGGADSRTVTPPTGWLLDYWLGRYHGFIEAPRTQDRSALQLEPAAVTRRGALPYAGPVRPE